jgi:hypothetical protein
MLGCVTLGSRNLSVAIQTDDAVIWVTGGSAARRGICCIHLQSPTVIEGVITSPLRFAMNTDDVVIWFTVGEDLWSHNAYHLW